MALPSGSRSRASRHSHGWSAGPDSTNGEPSAAKEAGLQAGDIMIEFDGYPIRGIDDLHKLLTDERIGRRTPVTVIRGVQKLSFVVVPKEAK